MEGRIDSRIDGWMDGWMEGWMDGWMVGRDWLIADKDILVLDNWFVNPGVPPPP